MPRKTKKNTTKAKPAPVKKTSTIVPLVIGMESVEALVALLEKSQLTELELDIGESRLYISKNGPSVSAPTTYSMPQPVAVAHTPAPAPVAHAVETSKPVESVIPLRKLAEVTSPMVGTFYAASSPDAEPYVRVGQIVKEDQTLCIIEAMKLMNEIEAEVTGKVVEICVKNAQPVEFGTVLFRIEPSV